MRHLEIFHPINNAPVCPGVAAQMFVEKANHVEMPLPAFILEMGMCERKPVLGEDFLLPNEEIFLVFKLPLHVAPCANAPYPSYFGILARLVPSPLEIAVKHALIEPAQVVE